MSDLTALNDWYERFHEECRRADALAAELAELRAAVSDWDLRRFGKHAERADGCIACNVGPSEQHLRSLAAQPQRTRGKALLAVVEISRRINEYRPVSVAPDELWEEWFAALAAIDGTQP